ncbi:MAG: hypothetical protein AAFV53_14640 [Myxococcota bacterium]
MSDGAPSTAATAAAIGNLNAGHRAWFWLCPNVDPPLMVLSLADDPSRQKMQAWIEAVDVPDGTESMSGLLLLDGQGTVQLVGPQGSKAMLKGLARWVQAHHAAHPQLARLRGASINVLNADGILIKRFAHNKLWTSVPKAAVAGTIRAAAVSLQALKENEDAWFWLARRGPDGDPFLHVVPRSQDESGAQFAVQVQALRRRSESGPTLRGVLRRTRNDGVVLTTTQRAPDWQEAVAAVIGHYALQLPPLRMLRTAQLVRMKERKGQVMTKREPLAPSMDLYRQCELIQTLAEDEPLYFWYTTSAGDNGPLLLLEPDTDTLRTAAEALGESGPSVRGTLRAVDGRIDFVVRKPLSGFLPQLASWVMNASERWPLLERLRGAQLVITDRNGAETRISDEAAWQTPAT